MARRSTQASVVPSVSQLRCNDLLFINEYLKPEHGLDATAAYRRLRPQVKYETAASQACRLLKKPQVQAEIANRIQHQGGVTKEYIESSLLKYQRWAEEKGDYVAGASICMDAAKLAGLITEKREVRDVTEHEWSAIRNLVSQSMRQPIINAPSDAVNTQ